MFDTGRLGSTSAAAAQFHNHHAKHEDLRNSIDIGKKDAIHIEASSDLA